MMMDFKSAQTLKQQTAEQLTAQIPVSRPKHRGLYAKWEKVDGKLICKWFREPD
jgi:hypothetical protein